MPPKTLKETLIFVINVGISSPNKPYNSIALDKAKYIVKSLIERKIFLRPKDEIGAILMGSEKTKNDLDIDNIEELYNVRVPDCDMVQDILNLRATNCLTHWVEAVYAAMKYIDRECVDSTMRKLILLSHFEEDADTTDQFDAQAISDSLKDDGVQLLAIGPDALCEISENMRSPSAKLLMNVCQQVDGQYLTYDEAISDVQFYEKPPPKPVGWHCNLELIDLEIPISAYVHVANAQFSQPWKAATVKKDSKQGEEKLVDVEPVREYFDMYRTSKEREDTAFAYLYGRVPVPFTAEDEETMVFTGGKRSYKIHNFSKRDEVDIQYWHGKSTRIIVPKDESSASLFYALVQAMADEDLVAIVRKVHNNNLTPRMVALFPRIKVPGEPWCLVEIELPFADDRRVMQPQPMKSILKELSQEQDEAVNNLLDSLMQPSTEEDDAARLYMPGCMPSPCIQHTWNMLSFRALNPDKPLPMMEEYLRKLLEPPASIQEKSGPCLEKIVQLFDLKDKKPEEDDSEIDKSQLDLEEEIIKSEKDSHSKKENIEKVPESKKEDNDDSFRAEVMKKAQDTEVIDLDDWDDM